MAKCPYCGEQLTEIADGVMSCAKCKKKFRKRTAAPATAQEPVPMPVREAPKAPAQATPPVPAAMRETRPGPAPSPISAPTPAPAETPKSGSAAEQEELAMLRARIAAMEAKQAELERGSVPKKREGGAGAAVISFAKKWGAKAVLPAVLVLIALITLLVCFCGVRGIYVNIDDPNEFYSFDATSYEYHGIFMGEEYVDKGTWKKSGGQLLLTYRDEDFGKVTESYDFSSLNSNKTLFISDDFGNKGEFKRVSLLAYGTSQKIKITLDGNGGSGGDSHKVQIGSKIQEPAEPTRDGYMFMGWYTSKEGWKNAEAKRIDFDDRVWEDVTYYANWKNTTLFNLTGDGLDEPVKFTEGDDVESLYMSARGWNSLPEGVTGLVFKDASGNEIDASSAPAGNVTVTVISDYLIENGVLKYVSPELNEFVIPDSVTSIGSYAFASCDSLTSIVIPDSVTSIGSSAFSGCSSLESMTLPFVGATKDGTSDTHFGYIFGASDYSNNDDYVPTSLKEVIITGGTSIGDRAFRNCTSLTSITIPDSVTSIGSFAFASCANLKSLVIPESVRQIANNAFAASGLTEITLPSGLNAVSEELCYNCKSLTSVIIPDSVTSIGDNAFASCSSLTSVTIGNGVTSIGEVAFGGCDSLEKLTVASGNPKYHSAGNCVIETAAKTLVVGCKSSVIPDDGSVTSIGDLAFCQCDSLISITIPDSVASIGSKAFYGCDALTSITIPDSVTSIGGSAFGGCTSLTSVTIPNSVTSIGNSAFGGCDSLESITIPFVGEKEDGTGETHFGYIFGASSGFYNDDYVPASLKEVVITGGTSIGDYAFYGCDSFVSVTIPDSVTSIGDYAFRGCDSLTSVTIPDSVTSIGSSAFRGCTSLTSITIPNSVTDIGSYAFYNCDSLTFVALGNGVTSIGSYAFRGCYKLIEVYNKSSLGITAGSSDHGEVARYAKRVYTEEGGSWLSDTEDGFRFIYDAANDSGYLVAYLGDETELTLPDSFTAYDGTEVTSYQIYDYAFYNCGSLTSITILDGVTSIGDYAFSGCTSLTSITIPDSVTNIGSGAFYGCTSLTSVAIPASVTSIGDYAFRGCDSLTSVTIPASVTSIGEEAFLYCEALMAVHITDIGKWVAIDFADSSANPLCYAGNPAYAGNLYLNGKLVAGDLTIPDGVTSIGNLAFYGCDALTSVTIPDSVTSIGSSAFSGCTSLTSITIPDSVTNIGSGAFYGCDNLQYNVYGNALYLGNDENPYVVLIKAKNKSITSVDIYASTKVIYQSAFSGCTSLTSITIPDSVTNIGSGAFYGCTSLTSVAIPASVTSIGDYAFRGCDSLTSVTIPDSVTSIGSSAFRGCTSLTSITIPNSVTDIGSYAFRDCTSLTSVTIGNGVTSIGEEAFADCTSLTSVTFNGTKAEWNAVSKARQWKDNCPFTKVKCSDGSVSVW